MTNPAILLPSPLDLTFAQTRHLLIELAMKYHRVAVVGVPGAGKTRLCKSAMSYQPPPKDLGRGVVEIAAPLAQRVHLFHTDLVVEGTPWETQQEQVRVLVENVVVPSIFEGVTVARCLRHAAWFDAVVVLCNGPMEKQEPGAQRLGKQVATWVKQAYHQDNVYTWFPVNMSRQVEKETEAATSEAAPTL